MNSLAEFLIVMSSIFAVALFFYSLHLKKQEQHLLEPVRRSSSYTRLYSKLDYLFTHYEIDQLRVEQRGVTATSVYPAHTLLDFDFKQNGNSKRCNSISTSVCQLLYGDFPILTKRDIYKITRYRVYRSNGKKEYGFAFTMRRSYKDSLLRAKSSVQLRIL